MAQRRFILVSVLALLLAGLAVGLMGCRSSQQEPAADASAEQVTHTSLEQTLRELEPVSLEPGEKLLVAATTGIIADVVANVGGDAIEVSQLIPDGSDPHSFTPTPQDLRALNDADVVFMNGLGLEESLLPVLENLDRPVPLVSVNVGVEALEFAGSDQGTHAEDAEAAGDDHGAEDDHGGVDPHAWFSVPNVKRWTDNIAATLSDLDPAHAEDYEAGAGSYLSQLDELDAELRALFEAIPEQNRKLVTDHVALAYLAHEYGLSQIGAILPAISTLAAASAQELAALQQSIQAEQVKAIFVSTTVNPQTANQLARDLGIQIVPLYTGSLSEAGGPADSYIEFMRYNVQSIVDALR